MQSSRKKDLLLRKSKGTSLGQPLQEQNSGIALLENEHKLKEAVKRNMIRKVKVKRLTTLPRMITSKSWFVQHCAKEVIVYNTCW